MANKGSEFDGSKYWYSPIYEENDYGFYTVFENHNYYLAYRPKDKRKNDMCVKISKSTYSALKKEWK